MAAGRQRGPIRDVTGAVVGAVLVFREITERKRAEEVLRASEERYRLLANATSDVVYRMSADWAEMQPLDGRTLVPSSAAPLRDWMQANLPDFEHTRVREVIDRAIATRQIFELEHQVNRADGSLGWTLSRAVPIRDAAGAIVEWFGTARDITDQKRAQDEVARVTAESERRKRLYETVLSATPDFVYVFSLDHRVIYANDALVAMWGRGTEGAIGKTFLEIGYESWHAEMHDREIDTVRETKKPIRGEVPFNGTLAPRIYDYIFVPVFGADGEVEAVAGTTRDVTDRKRDEEALRQSEELLRLATDAAELGVWVWDVGADRVTWENDRPYEIFGLHPSSGPVNAARFQDDFVHPDDAGTFGDAVADAVRTGDRFYFLGRLRRPDGEVRWVEFTGRPVRTADGLPLRMHGTAADVTERKRAEEALRASEAEFRATFERAGVGKAQADPNTGRLVRVNPKLCELLGYTADELLGMTIRDLTHPDERADGDARFRSLVAGEVDQYAVEKRYLRKGGAPVWVRVTATVVRGADGRPVRASAIIEDVTARMHAEAALKDADRKKDDFIALLAHELRNPLAPIRNGLQVIRLSEDQVVRDRSQRMMDRQLTHMVRLIDDLLDVSRITRNKMELRRARVALADVVGSAVETARPAVEEAGHELTVSLPERPVYLDADLTRLSQVFSNLLTNSAKYTERGGRIRLSAEPGPGGVSVSVRDTGIGIPADALPNIFDMFAQVDRPTERNTGGLGIGLALVKGLVEMHGGTVAARSEGPGRGSEFTVALPALADAPENTEGAGDRAPAGPGARRRVLVVDDNRDGAESLGMMLELLGNEIAMAHDGIEAVERAERFRPEVILMDVGMPKMDGLEATRRIRERSWGRRVTIIALTGWGQDADQERSRVAGCDGHLVKPVNLADLEKLVAELRG